MARVRPRHARRPGARLRHVNQARALGEGFGDYIALAMSQRSDALSGRTPTTPYPCIMDWDSVSYTAAPHCIRRADTKLTMATHGSRNIHHSGQIWSRALWDINQQVGPNAATLIIVEAQFQFARTTSYVAAGNRTIGAAAALYPAPADAWMTEAVRKAFRDRRIRVTA